MRLTPKGWVKNDQLVRPIPRKPRAEVVRRYDPPRRDSRRELTLPRKPKRRQYVRRENERSLRRPKRRVHAGNRPRVSIHERDPKPTRVCGLFIVIVVFLAIAATAICIGCWFLIGRKPVKDHNGLVPFTPERVRSSDGSDLFFDGLRVTNLPTICKKPSTPKRKVSLMTFNILQPQFSDEQGNGRFQKVLKVIRDQTADILLLQEVQKDVLDTILVPGLNEYKLVNFQSNGPMFWHSFLKPGFAWQKWGEAILIKRGWVLDCVKDTHFSKWSTPNNDPEDYALCPSVVLGINGMKVAITNVHLEHSDRFIGDNERGTAHMNSICKGIRSLGVDAVLMAGDFNNPYTALPLGYADVGPVYGGSDGKKATFSHTVAFRLDKIISSTNIRCLSFRNPYYEQCETLGMLWKGQIMAKLGTDHLPLVAEFEI